MEFTNDETFWVKTSFSSVVNIVDDVVVFVVDDVVVFVVAYVPPCHCLS